MGKDAIHLKMKRIMAALLALLTAIPAMAEGTAPEMPQITPPPLRSTVLEEILPENAVSSPKSDNIKMKIKKYDELEQVDTLEAEEPIVFGGGEDYTDMEGILTFRGNNFRDTGSYGTIPTNPKKLSVQYSFKIGGIDSWGGVGWTGQASCIRWPEETRKIMNLNEEKKNKEGLVEVVYATLGGKIYFFDMEDGEETREPINIGAPIKGSVSLDPRGYPLLYCGQGIAEVGGKNVKIGMRVFSLITGEELLFINGRDKAATRKWYASDCSPLVNAETDTLLWAGENGLFYRVKLNTDYDPEAGTISIDPEIDRYWYSSKVTTRPGMENSFSAYNHYVFLPDNSGLMQCLDINTLEPVWAVDLLDDTDASPALEVDENGQLWIYTGTEYDLGGKKEYCYIRKLNGFTGEVAWEHAFPCNNSDFGGTYATPAVGKGSVSDLVFYAEAKLKKGNYLMAVDKVTGEIRWTTDMGGYTWSSPTLVYDENDKAYLITGNSGSYLRIYDAETGKKICETELVGNIEGSPIVFNDMLVVGTRGRKIYGVKIK